MLDEEMAQRGFSNRAFPNGRVLRFCRATPDPTIAQIGRELSVSRQRAAQVVGHLRDDGYVTVTPSATSGKEKVVRITTRAEQYLAAHAASARKIERALERQLGPVRLKAVWNLIEVLSADDDLRMSDYLREKRQGGSLRYPEE
jgi:DNA-binding MarR family transcriptional regulator